MGTDLSVPLCGNTEATVSAKPGVAESSRGPFPFVVQILFCKMHRSTGLHFSMPSSCPRVANSFQALLQHSALMCQASSPLGYSFVSFLGHLAYRSSKQTERAGVGTKVSLGSWPCCPLPWSVGSGMVHVVLCVTAEPWSPAADELALGSIWWLARFFSS